MTGIVINNNEYTISTGSTKIEYNSTGNTVAYSIYGEEIPLGTATLTINPTPADAVVTINGQTTNSLMVTKGAPVTYTVSKTDYITKSATIQIYSNSSINVTLPQAKYEYAAAGTYELSLPSGVYKITMIAGGGGGASSYKKSDSLGPTGSGAGGGGSYYQNCEFYLPEDNYVITVGNGGSKAESGSGGAAYGGSGGSTKILNSQNLGIRTYGGSGGRCNSNGSTSVFAGEGGTTPTTDFSLISGEGSVGNNGRTKWSNNRDWRGDITVLGGTGLLVPINKRGYGGDCYHVSVSGKNCYSTPKEGFEGYCCIEYVRETI